MSINSVLSNKSNIEDVARTMEVIMTPTQQHIALLLLERTGSYLNFFISMDLYGDAKPLSESQKAAMAFLDEIAKFLREVSK